MLLIERCLVDVNTLARGDRPDPDTAETAIFGEEVLPPRFRTLYDYEFATKFLAVCMSVAWKAKSEDPCLPACVAEEMALSAVIKQAADVHNEIWELTEQELEISDLQGIAFEDRDLDLLWFDELDGFHDPLRAVAKEAGIRIPVGKRSGRLPGPSRGRWWLPGPPSRLPKGEDPGKPGPSRGRFVRGRGSVRSGCSRWSGISRSFWCSFADLPFVPPGRPLGIRFAGVEPLARSDATEVRRHTRAVRFGFPPLRASVRRVAASATARYRHPPVER